MKETAWVAGDKASDIIKNDLLSGRLNHAYLFHGAKSQDLHDMVLHLAKQILCPTHKPCEACRVCKSIDAGVYSDCLVYPKTEGASLKTNDANQIVEKSFATPFESEHKVFVLENFESATQSAQNKLLKTLEEPSKSVIFLITAQNLHTVLPTIISRSKVLYVGNKIVKDEGDKRLKQLALQVLLTMKKSDELLSFSNTILQDENIVLPLMESFGTIISRALQVLSGVSGVEDYDLMNLVATTYGFRGLEVLFNETLNVKKHLVASCNKSATIEHFLFKVLEERYLWQTSQT